VDGRIKKDEIMARPRAQTDDDQVDPDVSESTIDTKEKLYISCDKFKGMAISGLNGSKIEFDKDGKAEVSEVDYKRLLTMKEFKSVK
jgi:hypothetical protein